MSFTSGDEDFDIAILLEQANHALSRAHDRELKEYALSNEQASVLFTIQAIDDNVTIADLSKWLLREPHSVSTLVRRMEGQGLITRVKNSAFVRLALTEKGRHAYHQVAHRESIHKAMSCLSEEERRQLASCLKKLRNQAVGQIPRGIVPPYP